MSEGVIVGWEKISSPEGELIFTKVFPVASGQATVVVHVKGTVPHHALLDMEIRMDPSHVVKPSERDFLRKVLIDYDLMSKNLKSTQERSTQLINKAREWRKKIIALGGEDPGEP
jgi:hypothetical protein